MQYSGQVAWVTTDWPRAQWEEVSGSQRPGYVEAVPPSVQRWLDGQVFAPRGLQRHRPEVAGGRVAHSVVTATDSHAWPPHER